MQGALREATFLEDILWNSSAISASIARAVSKPMPDGTQASVPGQPAPAQAPFGSTPVTSPSANRGHEAAGMQKLGVVLQLLQEVQHLFGPGSEQWKMVHDMVGKLAKLIPAGAVGPAGQRNQLEQMAQKQGQQNQQMQMLRAQQAKAAQGGGAGAAGGMPQGAAA